MSLHPDDARLDGQVALVTGGASGIGRGIALGLASFGADIAIIDIDPEAGERTAADICALGRRACVVEADLRDASQAADVAAIAIERFGGVDILVNNAGGARFAPFLEQGERSRDRQIALNLSSMMEMTRVAASAMIARNMGGAIINVASIEGQRGAPGFSIYAACKAAMLNFTQSMALELGGHGIRVNAILPDIVITPGLLHMDPDMTTPARIAARNRYVPLGRDGDLDDCAGAAVFLASRLARYVTGAILNVDGGTSAARGWIRDNDGGWMLFPPA